VQQVLDQMTADGTPMSEIRQRLLAASTAGKPQSIAAVAEPKGNVQSLVRAAHTAPGPGRQVVEQATTDAVRGMAPRVSADVADMAGLPGTDTEAAQFSNDAARKAAAGPAYDQAFAQGQIDHPELTDQLNKGSRVYGDAHELMRANQAKSGYNDTAVAPLFEDGKVARTPTVQDIDMIKKGLDAKVRNAGGGLKIDEAGQADKEALGNYENLRTDLMGIMNKDGIADDYRAARQQFGDSTEISNALQDGRDLVTRGSNASPFNVKLELAKLSTAGQAAFRAGVLDALRRQIAAKADAAPFADVSREVIGSGPGQGGMKLQMLESVFGKGPQLNLLIQRMQAEGQRASLRNTATGGSMTANKAADLVDTAGEVAHAAASPVTATVGHLTRAWQHVAGKATRAEIAKGLTSPITHPDSDPFFRALQREQARREARHGDTGGVF
jgi:hypothetical protein